MATGMSRSSWAMMRDGMREVSPLGPTRELLLVDLWLPSEEPVTERKESEDHGESMMGLKLKVEGRSDCVEYCDGKQTDGGGYVMNLVGVKIGEIVSLSSAFRHGVVWLGIWIG